MLNQQKLITAAVVLSILLLTLTACNKGPSDKRIRQIDPVQADSVARAVEARVHPELAKGFTMSLWGVESIVADPVALNVDDQGKVRYTRTTRQMPSDFDIRGHQDWEIATNTLETIEDKDRNRK